MTISSTEVRKEYTGNASTTTFPFYGTVYAVTDIVVHVAGSLMTQGVHYDVVGTLPGPVNVVFRAAYIPALDASVIIECNIPESQATDLPAAGRYTEANVEQMADKVTRLIHQIKGRSVLLPLGSPVAGPLQMPPLEPRKFLRANPAGTGLEMVASSLADLQGILDDTIPSCAQAALPPAGTSGRLRKLTDAERGIFVDSGVSWLNLTPHVDVKFFGATGDGVTLDTAAIQAALDYAHILGYPVCFPIGHYLTDTLIYRGQSMFGAGVVNPGETDARTILRGLPGKDIFLVPDEAITINTNAYIHDMKLLVDGTVDASASFPNRVTYSGWQIGNAAFAFPWADGSDGHGVVRLMSATFSRITIEQYDPSGANSYGNKTCGFFFQTSPYSCTFEDVQVHVTEYGFVCTVPASVSPMGQFAPDCNLFHRIILTARRNFIYYGGSHVKIYNMQIYNSATTDNHGMLVLINPAVGSAEIPEAWVCSGVYIENNGNSTGMNSLIQGWHHMFLGGNLKQDGASNCYVQWDASNSNILQVGIGDDQTVNPSLIVNGNNNNFDLNKFQTTMTSIQNNGRGNRIHFASRLYGAAARRGQHPLRKTLFEQDAAWVSSPSAPYDSGADLVFLPEDFNVGYSTTDYFPITKDASIPVSRSYFTAASPGAWTSALQNGWYAQLEQRIPKTRLRFYFRLKASAPCTQAMRIMDGGGIFVSKTFSLTDEWQTFFMDVDYSSAVWGAATGIYFDGDTPSVAVTVDVAWIVCRPYADDLLGKMVHLVDGVAAPAAIAGVAQLYVDAADGDLKVKFGDGTVKTIATDT